MTRLRPLGPLHAAATGRHLAILRWVGPANVGVKVPLVLLLLVAACAGQSVRSVADPAPPSDQLGTFRDDYGSSYRISDTMFEHLPRARYRIVEWHPAAQFLIAQNDSANPGEPGRWTRIDWMRLRAMPPWEWGFCLTAYDAPSANAARATPAPNRAEPRTGCNGHPFTRMQRPP